MLLRAGHCLLCADWPRVVRVVQVLRGGGAAGLRGVGGTGQRPGLRRLWKCVIISIPCCCCCRPAAAAAAAAADDDDDDDDDELMMMTMTMTMTMTMGVVVAMAMTQIVFLMMMARMTVSHDRSYHSKPQLPIVSLALSCPFPPQTICSSTSSGALCLWPGPRAPCGRSGAAGRGGLGRRRGRLDLLHPVHALQARQRPLRRRREAPPSLDLVACGSGLQPHHRTPSALLSRCLLCREAR